MIKGSKVVFAAAILVVGLAPMASSACEAPPLLASLRAASGGPAWDQVREISAQGSAQTSGLSGTAKLDEDLLGGRYAERLNVAGQGVSATVYDGATLWSQDISGGVHALDSAFPRARARTEAFLARREYLRNGVRVQASCIGTHKEHGKEVSVVRVTPQGGIPADLSIDSHSHLLTSISERFPTTEQVTTFADYRRLGRLALPFSISTGNRSEPADASKIRIVRYIVKARLNSEDFRKPVATNEATLPVHSTSTTVAMTLEDGEVIVRASIDGHAPLPFILDTGGHAILTPEAAKSLGLRGAGSGQSGGSGAGTSSTQYTYAKSIRIGDAQFKNQHLLIIPYGYAFSERGRKTPLAGILGLEIFERFVVRLDYASRKVTLTRFAAFQNRRKVTPISIRFQEDMPMVEAMADGHGALFGTDTGNSSKLILFGKFLKRSGIGARYTHGYRVIGHGTGGANSGRVETLSRFTLGGRVLRNVTSVFTDMQAGSFSSWTEGGNIGYRVLSRFTPTYDYAREKLYLEPSPNAPPLSENRSGIIVRKNRSDEFDITLVLPGSVGARAGVAPGDVISAINGKSASDFSRADYAGLMNAPRDTDIRLTITHAGVKREVLLVLRS